MFSKLYFVQHLAYRKFSYFGVTLRRFSMWRYRVYFVRTLYNMQSACPAVLNVSLTPLKKPENWKKQNLAYLVHYGFIFLFYCPQQFIAINLTL
jgi:hypothetical protein